MNRLIKKSFRYRYIDGFFSKYKKLFIKIIPKKLQNPLLGSFLSGCILAGGFAPFYIPFFVVVSICFLFIIVDEIALDKKSGFFYGLSYGAGFFLCGNYWIVISLLVDAQRFAWLIPIAITLIPLFLGLYFAFLGMIYVYLKNNYNLKFSHERIFLFIFLWMIMEYLRSNLFGGFPWNLLGYSMGFNLYLLQGASLFGVYGLSLLTLFASLIPILIYHRNKSSVITMVIFISLFVANILFGISQIKNSYISSSENIIRAVQPNIKQELKWDPKTKHENLLETIRLSTLYPISDLRVLVWSETAVPYVLNSNPELLKMIGSIIPVRTSVITGGIRADSSDYEASYPKYYNSLYSIASNSIYKSYDKHRLVPFGEYTPLFDMIPFVQKFTNGNAGFSKGEGPIVMSSENIKITPLICFESIFPDNIIPAGDIANNNIPDVLINITNDSWFGNSTGPYQHFEMTRLRSIEYRVSLLRVANSGISAYIDPYGRIIKKIDLNQKGFFDVYALRNNGPTFFSKYQNAPLFSLLFLSLYLVFFIIRDRLNRYLVRKK